MPEQNFVAHRQSTGEYWVSKTHSTDDRNLAKRFKNKSAAIRAIGRSDQTGERASCLRRGWNLLGD